MKKRIKKFVANNALLIIAIVDAAALLVFFYMIFGFLWETAQFHMVMNSLLAG